MQVISRAVEWKKKLIIQLEIVEFQVKVENYKLPVMYVVRLHQNGKKMISVNGFFCVLCVLCMLVYTLHCLCKQIA